MVAAKLLVEGGGESKKLKVKCREGFRAFLEKVGLRRMPRITACGARAEAFSDFCTALRQAGNKNGVLLLVDSEDPIGPVVAPWEHVKTRIGDGWDRPAGADDNHLHFMVQCMESWFLADKETLADYFGQGFQKSALPANPKIEEASKADVLDGLKRATANTPKGAYAKGRHSFEILGRIDPSLVRKASPYAERFIKHLADVLKGQ